MSDVTIVFKLTELLDKAAMSTEVGVVVEYAAAIRCM
jgi:hypothetical protein